MMSTAQPSTIAFRTPAQVSDAAAAPYMDLPAAMVPHARRGASGVVVVTYPAPFNDLQIFDGEVLSMAKWQRYVEGVMFFRSLERREA